MADFADGWLRTSYERVKRVVQADYAGLASQTSLSQFSSDCLQYLLEHTERVELVSRVADKSYFTYTEGRGTARPANAQYFVADRAEFAQLVTGWQNDDLDAQEFGRFTYTAALAPCLVMELFDRGNKKGPATYFEWFIGHLFSKSIGVNPGKRVSLPTHGVNVSMTMDFVFNMGQGNRNIHMPVKMSTRERVVQAWSHQRLLDAAFGQDSYQGIMVCFSETKLDTRSLEVTEICVPNQWLAYQTWLATLDRIYYFDLPNQYLALTQSFPEIIAIREFQAFFEERDEILPHLPEIGRLPLL